MKSSCNKTLEFDIIKILFSGSLRIATLKTEISIFLKIFRFLPYLGWFQSCKTWVRCQGTPNSSWFRIKSLKNLSGSFHWISINILWMHFSLKIELVWIMSDLGSIPSSVNFQILRFDIVQNLWKLLNFSKKFIFFAFLSRIFSKVNNRKVSFGTHATSAIFCRRRAFLPLWFRNRWNYFQVSRFSWIMRKHLGIIIWCCCSWIWIIGLIVIFSISILCVVKFTIFEFFQIFYFLVISGWLLFKSSTL